MAAGDALKIGRRILDFAAAGVFLYAGILKALDPGHFALDVFNFQLLPWTGSALLALYLPYLEIVCGAALLVRRFYPGALLLLAALTLVFLGALGSAWFRGLDIRCGCFGHAHPHTVLQAIWQDAALLAVLVMLLAGAFKKK